MIPRNLAILLLLTATAPLLPAVQTSSGNLLARRYCEGEALAYRMTGRNEGPGRNSSYTATARGVVKKNSSGIFVEEYRWSDLMVNGASAAIAGGDAGVHQTLSLTPGYRLAVPDLRAVDPLLIGPITDFLTFYADLQLAAKQALRRPGDHVRVSHGAPNSWKYGNYVIAEDAIDFDITLKDIDPSGQTITIAVRHLPPAEPHVQLPAEWMRVPVVDSPNNWVQVEKQKNGKYIAAVGKEMFDVEIKLSLADGKILSATLDNPVEVLQRECGDAELKQCGEPRRYRIRRNIELASM